MKALVGGGEDYDSRKIGEMTLGRMSLEAVIGLAHFMICEPFTLFFLTLI